MKRYSAVLVAALVLTPATLAQKPDLNELNQKIATLYSQGKFDDAIPIAEKIVSAERKAARNSVGTAVALANLAQLHKEKAKFLRANLSRIDRDRRSAAIQTSHASADTAKQLYRQALEIYKALGSDQTWTVASLKIELAWLSFSFLVTDSVRESRAQIDEAERLYSEAALTAENLPREQINVYLTVLKDFGDFYMKYVNFEKALPLFEKHVAAADKAFGANAKESAVGLRGLYEVYLFTMQDEEVVKVLARLTAAGAAGSKPAVSYPPLTLRTRGIGKVKADGFLETNFTDLDRSFSATSEMQRRIQPRNQYVIKPLQVDVVVDENGSVIEAKAVTASKYTAQIEEAAMASKFRPFEYGGVRRKMKGKIVFHYKD